jgi:hypothetical protein
MSYIRSGWPLKYVEGDGEDYVFPDCSDYIEDYNKISDKGFIELLFKHWKTDDKLFKEHLLKRLAERLNVKLRDKPLTEKEVWELMDKKMKSNKQ